MRFVSYVDDNWRERVGLERSGSVHPLPVGLTMGALLAAGPRAMSVVGDEAASGPAIGKVADLRLLPAVPRPGKVVCLAGNYQEHIREGGGKDVDKARSTPNLFIKPQTTLAPPGATVARSRMTDRLDYECELAIVIGREARDVPEGQALACIAGYTVANDVSSRRLLHDGRDPDTPKS